MISQQKIKERIDQLKMEFEKGKNNIMDLDQKREETRHTMMRIDGAVKVLEELLLEASAHEKSPQKEQEVNIVKNENHTAKKMAVVE